MEDKYISCPGCRTMIKGVLWEGGHDVIFEHHSEENGWHRFFFSEKILMDGIREQGGKNGPI